MPDVPFPPNAIYVFHAPSQGRAIRLGFTGIVPSLGEMELAIHNHLGLPVRVLARGMRAANEFEALWDGKDEAGKPVPAGRYWFRIITARRIFSRMLILVR